MKLNKIAKIIILISFIGLFSICSSLTIDDVVYGANIKVSSNLSNTEIQSIIDNTKSGDTLVFSGSNYNNVSLTINKTLHIVGKNKAILKGSSNKIEKTSFSSIFYFKEGSSGSSISGINLIANEYGIVGKNTKNIKIFNNTIMNALKAGILLDTTKSCEIYRNYLINNNNGIIIRNSNNTNIYKNYIKNNNATGVTIYSSRYTKIANNRIENNKGSGISIQRTLNTEIINNLIYKNKVNGIELIEITRNTIISKNNISQSSRGILIDSNSKNDSIISNNIRTNIDNGHTDRYHTAIGILFGYSYNDRNKAPKIQSNAFYGNSRFSIRANSDLIRVNLASNWYGSNYDSYSGLCPKISSNLITAKLINTQNGYKLAFFDGNKRITDLPSFDVTFYLNGVKSKTIKVVNGIASYIPSSSGLVSVLVDRDTISLNRNSNDPNYQWGEGLGNGDEFGIGDFDTVGETDQVNAEQEELDNSKKNSGSNDNSDEDSNGEAEKSQNPKEIIIDDDSSFIIEDNQYLTYIVIIIIAIAVILGYSFKKR